MPANKSAKALLSAKPPPRWLDFEICRVFCQDRWAITLTLDRPLWNEAAQLLQADSTLMTPVLDCDRHTFRLGLGRHVLWQPPTVGLLSRWGFGGCVISQGYRDDTSHAEFRIPVRNHDGGFSDLLYMKNVRMSIYVMLEAIHRAKERSPFTATDEVTPSQGIIFNTFNHGRSPFTVAIDKHALLEIQTTGFGFEPEGRSVSTANEWMKIIWDHLGETEPPPICELIDGKPEIWFRGRKIVAPSHTAPEHGAFLVWHNHINCPFTRAPLELTVLCGLIQLVQNTQMDRSPSYKRALFEMQQSVPSTN